MKCLKWERVKKLTENKWTREPLNNNNNNNNNNKRHEDDQIGYIRVQ
jgi:hypothetical protein